MSEFHVETVTIGAVEKHPNADTLSVTKIHGGYPVIFRTGEYQEGQLATYIPVDAIVPDVPAWSFLNGNRRIKAKRLRGVFSMGLLAAHVEGTAEGDNVQEALGITKWEPPCERFGNGPNNPRERIVPADTAAPPLCVAGLGKYDLEGLRKYSSLLVEGEQVVITEKIHGANFRAVHDGERLHVGSRTRWLKDMPGDAQLWWEAARSIDLEATLSECPGVVVFGEVYGQVQDLKYGVSSGAKLAFFDLWSEGAGWRSDPPAYCGDFDGKLPPAPELYRGPWHPGLVSLAEGPSMVPGANHVREGFVVRPVERRFEQRLQGELVLKMVGEGYLTRKVKGE